MSFDESILLHPELLSNDQLRNVIRERHLKFPLLEQMLRENLLEICHQYCVPYAQRQYRDSGRGKILNKNRSSTGNSPTKTHSSSKTATTYQLNTVNSIHSTNCKDRLRPPPDLLSIEIKKIKLSSATHNTNHIDANVKRKNESKERPTSTNGLPPEKRARKQITPITWP